MSRLLDKKYSHEKPPKKDKRFLRRRPLEEIDFYSISYDWQGETVQSRPMDLTSNGALIQVDPSSSFEVGSELEKIEVFFGPKKIGVYKFATVVSKTPNDDGGYNLGLYFHGHEVEKRPSRIKEKRTNRRFFANTKFKPQGYFNHPTDLNKIIYFEVEDISKDGMRISTSARNSNLFRGTEIEKIVVQFPNEEPVALKGLVNHFVSVPSENKFHVGIIIRNKLSDFAEAASRYLLSFGIRSYSLMKELRRAKLASPFIKQAFVFDLVRNREEFEKVLKLRHKSYLKAKKVDASLEWRQMADEYDYHSHIVIAKHGEEIIGSLRLTYLTQSGQKFELEQFIDLPDDMNGNNTLEVSRACINPAFQMTDILQGMFEITTDFCIRHKKKYLISSCESRLLKKYSPLGFKETGQTYSFEKLNSSLHVVISMELETVYTAKGLDPITWYHSYGQSAKNLQEKGLVTIKLPEEKRVELNEYIRNQQEEEF